MFKPSDPKNLPEWNRATKDLSRTLCRFPTDVSPNFANFDWHPIMKEKKNLIPHNVHLLKQEHLPNQSQSLSQNVVDQTIEEEIAYKSKLLKPVRNSLNIMPGKEKEKETELFSRSLNENVLQLSIKQLNKNQKQEIIYSQRINKFLEESMDRLKINTSTRTVVPKTKNKKGGKSQQPARKKNIEKKSVTNEEMEAHFKNEKYQFEKLGSKSLKSIFFINFYNRSKLYFFAKVT